MVIKNLNKSDIINNKNLNLEFLSANLEKLNLQCKLYKGDFYLDSFHYFPITKDYYSFLDIFSWKEKSEYNHFFTEKFYSDFAKNKKNFKKFNDVVVLGSSAGDNYFRNLITFIPRLLFIPDKEVSLVIHRKSSNKLREFIESILKIRGIKLKKFIYLDDNFYNFTNSLIPQYFSEKTCVKILNNIFKKKQQQNNRIYLTRKNSYYRKIINESDLIEELKLKKFKIIDLDTLSIDQQVNVFSSASIIVSPTSSALANIVFCQKGSKIYEIIPKYQYQYENHLKFRYSYISKLIGCEYYSIEADPIPVEGINENIKKFININTINQSNYYKNLLVKKDKFKKIIQKI